MTYIELFDRTHTANVCGMLTNPPDRVILVGEKYKTLQKHAVRYREVMLARGQSCEVIPRSVNKNNITSIIELFSSIIDEYDDCHFDLTGGEDLFLCAAGIVSERYKSRGIHVNMHRFNIRSNRVIDCDLDGVTVMENALPSITIDENIRIWGGQVKGRPYSPHDFDDESKNDIAALWEICRYNVKAWNRQLNIISAAEKRRNDCELKLTTEASVKNMYAVLNYDERKHVIDQSILQKLNEKKLISFYCVAGGTFEIKYKSPLVKSCLTKAGLVLELWILLCADQAKNNDGQPIYCDVKSVVYIDWDGEVDLNRGRYDTENEVDVMLIHGALPVFVSCKNGAFDMEELYKLNSVAERFGREYSKKVIITTAIDSLGALGNHIRQRASDMDIRIIDRAHSMTESELVDVIATLWM